MNNSNFYDAAIVFGVDRWHTKTNGVLGLERTASGKYGGVDFSFIRTSTKWVNLNAVQTLVATGVLGVGTNGALFELSATNILLRSTLAGGTPPTGWSRPNAGGTNAATTSIFGNADGAVAFQMSATNNMESIESDGISFTSGTTVCVSVLIEAVTGNIQAQNFMRFTGSISGTRTYRNNGIVISDTTNIVAGLFEMVFAFTGNSTNSFRMGAGNGLSSVTGSVTISRPQVELNAYRTSWIPTTTTTQTRQSDVLSIGGLSGTISSTEGTIYAEVFIEGVVNKGARTILSLTGNANARYIRFRINGVNLQAEIFDGTSFLVQPSGGTLVQGLNKVSVSWRNGEVVSLFLNGVNVVNSTTVTTHPLYDSIIVGANQLSSAQLGDSMRIGAYWNSRLLNSRLLQLTTL